MKVPISNKGIAAAAGAALVAAGGSAAIAANTSGSPSEQSAAIVEDAASQLGVDAASLSAALKQALSNRVDAALAAGTITEEQAAEMKERIESQDYPLLGGPGFGHRGSHGGRGFGHLDAAAAYLGVTEAELRTQLEDGKTLADVAKAEGKTVDGLVAALVADKKKELDEAVSSGRLTQAQRDEMLENVEQRFTDRVNGEMPERGPHGPRGFGGPPPSSASDSSSSSSYTGPTI